MICGSEDKNGLSCLREKGSLGINNAAEKRGSTVRTFSGQYVHVECRRRFLKLIKISRKRNKENPLLVKEVVHQFSDRNKVFRSATTASFVDRLQNSTLIR